MPNLCLLSCSADHVSVHHAALAKEGEHADALSDLLFVVDSATGHKFQELYFSDAVSDNSEVGNGIRSV
jgi:hypothetical protein